MKKAMISALILLLLLAGCATTGSETTTKTLTRGIWDGNTYTSEYAGLTFEKPEEWVIATDEDISEVMSVGAEIISEAGMAVSEELLQLRTIYEMMASDSNTGNNIIVMYENMAMIVGGSKMTEKQYLEELLKQLDAAALGYTYGDIKEETLGDQTYSVVRTEIELGGIKAIQLYYARKVDKYMLAIIVSVMDGDDTLTEILSGFSN